MGLIIDTCVLIGSERRGETPEHLLRHTRFLHGDGVIALSVVSVAELTHGIYRTRNAADQTRRELYSEEVFGGVTV